MAHVGYYKCINTLALLEQGRQTAVTLGFP
jgi:hypothetical protein